MIIDPRTMKTSSQERHYLFRALDTQLRKDCARLERLTSDEKRWDCKADIAVTADLISKLKRVESGEPTAREQSMHDMVCKQGITIKSVAGNFCCSTTTVRRAMDKVTEYGSTT